MLQIIRFVFSLLFPFLFIFTCANAMLQSPSAKSIGSSSPFQMPANSAVSSHSFARAEPKIVNPTLKSGDVKTLRFKMNRHEVNMGPVTVRASAAAANNNNGSNQQIGIEIRVARPDDAQAIQKLFREMMAQAQNDHLFDGPLNNPTRQQKVILEQDLCRGRVHAFVADAVMQRGSDSPLRQMVAYALYNYGASSHQGKEGEIIQLEDFYVDPNYQGFGVERLLLSELAKTANQKGVASVEWAVPRSRTDDTIEHHFNNNQLELLQRGKQENYWRLPVTAFQRVLDLDEDEDGYIADSIDLNEFKGPEKKKRTEELADIWCKYSKNPNASEKKEVVAQMLVDGRLRAITVRNLLLEDVKAIALFHTKAYALWTGQYVWLDSLCMGNFLERTMLPSIVYTVMAELVKEAHSMNADRIEWTIDEAGHDGLFKSLNAIDLTESENGGWQLYEWNYCAYNGLTGQQ